MNNPIDGAQKLFCFFLIGSQHRVVAAPQPEELGRAEGRGGQLDSEDDAATDVHVLLRLVTRLAVGGGAGRRAWAGRGGVHRGGREAGVGQV